MNELVQTSPEAQHRDDTPAPRPDSTAAVSRGPKTEGRPAASTSSPSPALEFPGQPGSQGRGAGRPREDQRPPSGFDGEVAHEAVPTASVVGQAPSTPPTPAVCRPGPHAPCTSHPQRPMRRPHAHHGRPPSVLIGIQDCLLLPEGGRLDSPLAQAPWWEALRFRLERPLLVSFSWSRPLDADCWGRPLQRAGRSPRPAAPRPCDELAGTAPMRTACLLLSRDQTSPVSGSAFPRRRL